MLRNKEKESANAYIDTSKYVDVPPSGRFDGGYDAEFEALWIVHVPNKRPIQQEQDEAAERIMGNRQQREMNARQQVVVNMVAQREELFRLLNKNNEVLDALLRPRKREERDEEYANDPENPAAIDPQGPNRLLHGVNATARREIAASKKARSESESISRLREALSKNDPESVAFKNAFKAANPRKFFEILREEAARVSADEVPFTTPARRTQPTHQTMKTPDSGNLGIDAQIIGASVSPHPWLIRAVIARLYEHSPTLSSISPADAHDYIDSLLDSDAIGSIVEIAHDDVDALVALKMSKMQV